MVPGIHVSERFAAIIGMSGAGVNFNHSGNSPAFTGRLREFDSSGNRPRGRSWNHSNVTGVAAIGLMPAAVSSVSADGGEKHDKIINPFTWAIRAAPPTLSAEDNGEKMPLFIPDPAAELDELKSVPKNGYLAAGFPINGISSGLAIQSNGCVIAMLRRISGSVGSAFNLFQRSKNPRSPNSA